MRPVRKTFPANLLIEGATALVVGGGRVGLRKTKALLEAGAAVRLVCPEAVADFDELPVERVTRCFVPDDVAGCRLVFACTDDKHTNRAVLAAARAKGVACCCADGNWAEGDFIVPATLRMEGLTLAVSTDGRSCRTAKEVREGLARSLARVSPGVLYVLGVEEPAALPPIETLAARFAFLNGLYGWALLRTCNRTELIAWAAPELIASGLPGHALHLPGARAFVGPDAMRHLTMVLAGMRAKMAGEFHIVGQVRDAFEEAREQGWACSHLMDAYAEALRRAQAVRAAVAPLIPNVEVEELALDGAKGRVVVAGTGRLGRAAVAKAHAMGLPVTVLYHRTPLEGEDCRPLDAWRETVRGADRFLAALTVEKPCFDAAGLGGVPAYDLGAPRNIAGDDGVRDLDDLRGDYLRRTGALDALLAAAEQAYDALP